MKNIEEIYVYLLDEGIDVWRPVDAIKIEENLYKIVSIRDSNKTETLEFNIGDIVKTMNKLLSGGNRIVAISKINQVIDEKTLINLFIFFSTPNSQITVNVNGFKITVRGTTINGVPKIGTAFIP